MNEKTGLSSEEFATLVRRAGMTMNEAELEHLKPMYEHFADSVQQMHLLDLGMEDLAVTYIPNWEPLV
ncbi:MAG: hypothetical protein O2821_13300 [Chloroflexi bacterium]|nr:hypothetical protein [Chloroflexota bacterium]MDA1226904.1 hypothetical protein [Chloroflexota bacterium]